MENKKTTELIDEFIKLPEQGKEWESGGRYEQLMKELSKRYPFQNLLNKEWEDSLPFLFQEVEELKEEIKKLKRHKHDEKTGDVMIRV